MEKATFLWQVFCRLNEVKYWGNQSALTLLFLGIYFKNTNVFKASLIHTHPLFALLYVTFQKNVGKPKCVFSLFPITR